jgi:hypothetical protein
VIPLRSGNSILNDLNVSANSVDADQDAQIEHLTKVVRILWRQVERLEGIISGSDNEVTIKSGSASIVLKKDGSIELRAAHNVTIEGGGNMSIKAGGRMTIKAARIDEN